MDISMVIQNQLLATKFYVPVASGTLISRARLTNLLDKNLKYPLTLVSAPAGFGKTTLLAAWAHVLSTTNSLVAWVTLDEEDNEPRLFWTYVLTALEMQQPQRFLPVLALLQSPQAPPLSYILTVLINLLADNAEHFVLILDDYQMIIEPEVHTTLLYLLEHLPSQLRIIVATRADPPLPLPLLLARRRVLEVRADQLRCTAEETRVFFDQVIGIQLPQETIEQVTTRTEGWWVGLQLLGLSLRECANPLTLLQEVSGDQRYILDYLTEQVLQCQPQEVQTFLLSTCILQRLSSSLCDAVMQRTDSQQMLEQLEQSNLFVVSLDNKREWYRYHALFAEALHYQLEKTHADLVPILHHRASLWYAEHHHVTEAILHALPAHQWQWAADLIERLPLMTFAWGACEQELTLLRRWLEQLPADVMNSRPSLCLACTQMLWAVAPYPILQMWLDVAEAMLTTSLTTQMHGDTPQARQEQEDLLGGVIAFRAFMWADQENGEVTLSRCQQALALISAGNLTVRSLIGSAQLRSFYASSLNNAVVALEGGLQAGSIAREAGQIVHAISAMGTAALHMIGTGRLHEVHELTQQAMQLGKQPREPLLPEAGWPALLQADILREWNQLDAAHSLALHAISLCKQTTSLASLVYSLCAYSVLLRISLSRGELDAACSALQQVERIGKNMNQPTYICLHSFFTTVDQVRLWLACGELDRATRWAEMLDVPEQYTTPFALEREEVAHLRILLATAQANLALERLEAVLQRATMGQRWGHVIEIRLLQALAHQMRHEVPQALDVLLEAVRLAEPEGYIRSFVDEGLSIAALLFTLRERQRQAGPTPYLDTLLTAFPQPSQPPERQPRRAGERAMAQPLQDPLSERELEVLQLLARGASNQEIAQELVIVVDTVKRHVSHIFSKLGVPNRVKAIIQAKNLNLLDEEF